MIVDLPSTNATTVDQRLIRLREEQGVIAQGRVLTLVVIPDDEHAEEAISSANMASHEHPCRILVVIRGTSRGSSRLDAQIRVGGDAGASEVIVLRTYGPLTAHTASLLVPLLLPDAPTVAWWPNEAPESPADDPVGTLAQRRITDTAACKRPITALHERVDGYKPGDTDLAWSRLTPWRALLAAALDQPPFDRVTAARVVGGSENPSADLLAGWLALALKVPVTRTKASGIDRLLGVRLDRPSGPISIDRPDEEIATLTTPGLADRRIALPRRTVADCMAEELRRLDPDETYGEVLETGLELQRSTGKVTRTSRTRQTG